MADEADTGRAGDMISALREQRNAAQNEVGELKNRAATLEAQLRAVRLKARQIVDFIDGKD